MTKTEALANVTKTSKEVHSAYNTAEVRSWEAINAAREAGATNEELEAAIDQGSVSTMLGAFKTAQSNYARNPVVVSPGGLEFAVLFSGWIRINGPATFTLKVDDLTSDNWTVKYDM